MFDWLINNIQLQTNLPGEILNRNLERLLKLAGMQSAYKKEELLCAYARTIKNHKFIPNPKKFIDVFSKWMEKHTPKDLSVCMGTHYEILDDFQIHIKKNRNSVN
jgi:hypothetical protein